jgi:hypothetical protein
MIDRTYSCDLCRQQSPRDKLVPIRWEPWVGHVSRDRIVIADEGRTGPSERHLCRKCIQDIKDIALKEATTNDS